MNREKLSNWLRKAFYEERDEGPCVKVTLRHINAAGKSNKDDTVFELRVPHNDDLVTVDEEELSLLVNDIEHAAHDDAEGLGGTQRYRLLAYFLHATQPLTRFTFRMYGSELEDEDEAGLSEPATKGGITAQHMRFTESCFRTTTLAHSQTIGMLQRQCASLNSMVERLVEEKFHNLEVMENLKSEQHLRELATEAERNKQNMYSEAFSKASILVPLIVNKLAGKSVFPVDSSPMMESLKGFAESLSTEQAQKMLNILKPEQQLVMVQLMEHVQEKEEEQEDKKRKLISVGNNK